MTPELAQWALNFLGKTTLTGAEVGSFYAVVKALENIVTKHPSPAAQPESDQPDVYSHG